MATRRVTRAVVECPSNVYDAALNRIRWLWDEFDGNVSASVSGGKDSTVVMELAATVARERGERLKVQFLDQEAEWQGTRDYLRHLKDDRDDIDFDWYQVPFRLFNSTSIGEEWGYMWDASLTDADYVRPREPDTIHENPFTYRNGEPVDRFKDMLHSMNKSVGGVHLTGMRTEESPTRRLGSTSRPAYKWATWGAGAPDGSSPFYLMHPIYDWSYRDVWKAINDHEWVYNSVYDAMFRHGVPTRSMRVSSLIHEHAVVGLTMVQEIEPETWDRLVKRFPGINSQKHVGDSIFEEFRHKRPWMFDTWREYLNYLIDNLIPEETHRVKFRKMCATAEREFQWMPGERICQLMLTMVLRNDYWSESSFSKFMVANKAWEREHDDYCRDMLARRAETEAQGFEWRL